MAFSTITPPQEIKTEAEPPGFHSVSVPSPPALSLPESEEGNRFIKGADTDWLDLVDHQTTLPADMPLEQVQERFRTHPDCNFAVVLDANHNILGLCSEQKIGNTLSQWGVGYAVFARKPVRNHILQRDLRIIRGTPVHKVLNAIMRREDDFFDDVMLVDDDGVFLGLIRVRTLVHLQHEINRQQYERIKGISDQLNINNEELAKARDEAMQAAAMKSTFLANMSHEIRTPMNGILGMIKILMRTPLNEQQKRYAKTVQNSGNALLTILNDILDFSKIEAGKLEIENIDFQLPEIIEETVELMTEKAREKNLEIFSWINTDVTPHLVSDPTRLRQVLLNLTSNAIKFTEKGEVMLKVSKESEDESTATVRIDVVDTGIGISEENQKKLFQAFQQADSATTRKFGGTGLGLAISRRITELLGGRITLKSKLGEGSTFSVIIPFQKSAQATAVTDEEVKADFWGLRSLIVTDSATYGDHVRRIMQPWNIISRHVETIDEAFSTAVSQGDRGTPMDLILIDAKIQGQSGLDLVEKLRESGKSFKSRVLVMAAEPEEFDRARARGMRLEDCVQKPVKSRELKEAIERILEKEPFSQTALVDPVVKPEASPATEEPKTSSPGQAEAGAPLAQEAETPVQDLVPKSDTPPMKLLLVEDSEVNREVAVIQLSAWNHNISTAEDGRQAIDLLEKEDFDGVLMDVQMPEMDGYEATREIRRPDSTVRNHDIYVIAMTANALQGDREKCLEAGMNDYVSKPVDEIELISALKRCHEFNQSPGNSVPPMPPAPAGQVVPAPPSPAPQATRNPAPILGFPPHLIDMFVNETRKRLEEIEKAVQTGSWEEVSRTAHTIKGTAGNFKAEQLAEFARECEQAALSSHPEQTRTLISRMKQAFDEHVMLLQDQKK